MSAENTIYFAILVSLVALAITELVLAWRISKSSQQQFARTYFFYLVSVLLFGFFAYIGQNVIWRALASIAEDTSGFRQVFLYFPFLSYPFLMLAGYFFLRFFAEIVNENLDRSLVWAYWSVVGCGFFGFGVFLVHAGHQEAARFANSAFRAQVFFGLVQLAVLLVAVSIVFRNADNILLQTRRRSIRRFAAMYLVLELTRISLSVFVEDRLIVAIPYLFLFFGGDIGPLLFLRRVLTRYWQRQYDDDVNEAQQSLLLQYDLTPRQAEIVSLICDGKTNHQIADELSVSLQTVKTHVYNIFAKTGVKNRVQLSNLFRNR